MVSSQLGAIRREMPESRKPKDTQYRNFSCDVLLLPSGPNLPMPTQNTDVELQVRNEKNIRTALSPTKTGTKKQKPIPDKKYLGVRVRMPVRDMLKNIRIANGIDPKELQGKQSKASKGDKKRVNTSVKRRNCLVKKGQTKGLEELAILVEVLEEDLKTCQSYQSSNKRLSSLYHSEYQEKFQDEDSSQQGFMTKYDQEIDLQLSPSYSVPSENSPVHSVSSPYPSPAYNHGTDVFFGYQEEYHNCEADTHWYDDQYGVTSSPASSYEHQVHFPQESYHVSPSPEGWEVSSQNMNFPPWPGSQHEWSSKNFFLMQIEREKNLLKEISDQELLAVDKNGRTLLHRMVEEGKRSLVYVIARRMAALRKLDMRDLEGKTPLHLSAQRNQHFMVSDLVSLGANINENDSYGKTCLHHSAENGYIRVLEVLKGFMRNGIYINLEARDANGLSALQCAAVALNGTVRELKLCKSAAQVRLQTLRKEQMMETLECLLQMENYLHALVKKNPVRLNEMRRGVGSKPYEQAFFQSNEIKAFSQMT